MSDRQKLVLALLASAVFHLTLAVVLGLWAEYRSEAIEMAETPAPEPDLSQLTVTVMPQKPPAPANPMTALPTPRPPQLMPVLDSDGLARSQKAPEHPMFQSDSNMAAGSTLPATGNIPLPSQQGHARNFVDFQNQTASFGKGQTAANAARPRPAVAPAQSMPMQTPYAVTQVQHSPTPAPEATPTPTPAATPRPLPTAAPDQFALGTPSPTPAPAEKLPTPVAELAKLIPPPPMRMSPDMDRMTPQRQPARPAPPQPAQPAQPPESQPERGNQLNREMTRINGGITARGAPGVDAVETPYGRYHRKLSNLIGSRWQLYLQEHPKDVGEVTILVLLNMSGKVAATRIIANHAVDDLAELSTRAILESDLPPVPDDLAPMLRDGKLEISFNFSVYDPDHDSPDR
jgi:hypothetical protein